jgi:uncharacterized membrane protein
VFDVNNHGLVPGMELTSSLGEPVPVAWWTSGRERWLQPLPGFSTLGEAHAVNDHGVIVGTAAGDEEGTFFEAVRWPSPRAVPLVLERLAGTANASASGINQNGVIVGVSDGIPVVWHGTTPLRLRGGEGGPSDVNEHGVIAGSLVRGENYRAVIWHRRRPTFLPLRTAYGFANAINNCGDVVGTEYHRNRTVGVIWIDGRRFALDSLLALRRGWHVEEANDISDSGYIAAVASRDGHQWAVRLTLKAAGCPTAGAR